MAKKKSELMPVIFTEEQRACLQTKIMRFTVLESLQWLAAQGYEMSQETYSRKLREINKVKDFHVLHIASRGLFEQHMERIANLELVLKLSWQNYHKLANDDAYKSQRILDSIAMQQPMLSQYYEATKFILKEEFPELVNEFEKAQVDDPKRIIEIFQRKDLEKVKVK